MAVCSFLCFCRLFSTAEAAVYMFSMKRCPPGIWPSHKRYGVCRGVWVWHRGHTGLWVQSGGFTSCPPGPLSSTSVCSWYLLSQCRGLLLGGQGHVACWLHFAGGVAFGGSLAAHEGSTLSVLCPPHQGL